MAAIAAKDPRKGERVVLVTDREDVQRGDLSSAGKTRGIVEIIVPSEVRVMGRNPLLASGKADSTLKRALTEQKELAA